MEYDIIIDCASPLKYEKTRDGFKFYNFMQHWKPELHQKSLDYILKWFGGRGEVFGITVDVYEDGNWIEVHTHDIDEFIDILEYIYECYNSIGLECILR